MYTNQERTMLEVKECKIILQDTNGVFVELDREEFLMALTHGLGFIASQAQSSIDKGMKPEESNKIGRYVRSLHNIVRKIRPTHLLIGIKTNDRIDRSDPNGS